MVQAKHLKNEQGTSNDYNTATKTGKRKSTTTKKYKKRIRNKMYTYERRTGEVGACCCWLWDVSGMFVQDNNASFTVEQCLSALHDLTYYRLD